MGKSRLDGTKRLAFPPWQRFICIHSDRPVPEIDEGRLASRDQSHHTFCTEEMAETTTPFRKPAWAQMRPSRFRWNLVPRLTDTRRIRISNPLENSSSRNSKKLLPNLAKSITQALQGQFWRDTQRRKEQEALYKPCKRHDPAPTISWASRCRATQLNWCRRNVYVAMQAVLQRETARDVIVSGPITDHEGRDGKCEGGNNKCDFLARESANLSPILARQWWRHFRLWWPLRERRDGKCEGGNDKCEFLARESANLSPMLARQFWRHFRLTTSVSLLPSHHFRLTTSVSLSLSPIVPHAQYRKRFRASYNKFAKVIIIIFDGWAQRKRRKFYFSYQTSMEKNFSLPAQLEKFLWAIYHRACAVFRHSWFSHLHGPSSFFPWNIFPTHPSRSGVAPGEYCSFG